MQKTLFVDLNLHSAEEITDRTNLLQLRSANINYTFFLPSAIEVVMIHLAGFKDEFKEGNVHFVIRKQKNRWLNTFLLLFFYLRQKRPNVVLMHGFKHPLHIILCKLILGSRTKIILQNHGEKPYKKVRLIFQCWADKCISKYLFVDKAQAKIWIDKKIISEDKKVLEVMEGSTHFKLKDKAEAKQNLRYSTKIIFLWVGRLDRNKDPIAVLKAFSEYIKQNQNVKLLMIYGSNELEKEVEIFINQNNLSDFVDLLGTIEHPSLEEYYNAADYFILGSHHEGSGYALCEAMACGCVPIVTSIPSFYKMTNEGRCGYLFNSGDSEDLLRLLSEINFADIEKMSKLVMRQFNEELSFEAIAKKNSKLISELSEK